MGALSSSVVATGCGVGDGLVSDGGVGLGAVGCGGAVVGSKTDGGVAPGAFGSQRSSAGYFATVWVRLQASPRFR